MRRLLILSDAASMAAAAAEEFVRAVQASKGPFRVALSGGSTPKAAYARLAESRARVPWARVHFFWGDERCVAADHPDSNYRMAREELLDHVPVPAKNIHRIFGERSDAAGLYEETLTREFGGPPRFDFIFLGLGPDGHTASLFPGTTAVGEKQKSVASVWVEEKKTYRVTLTLPVLNAAAQVVFLASGADKADMVRSVLETPADEARPASLVSPESGNLLWILDRAAASRLASSSST